MAGKYQKRREPIAVGTRAAVAAGLVASFVLGVAADRLVADPGGSDAGKIGAQDGSCTERPLVRISAAPEIATVVRDAAQRVSAKGICGEVAVKEATAAQVAGDNAKGFPADVWVPESSVWLDAPGTPVTAGAQAAGTTATFTAGPSIASSPVLVASDRARAASSGKASWPQLLSGTDALRMANPDQDTASRLALFASRSARGGSTEDVLRAGSGMIFLSRSAAQTTDELLADYAANPTGVRRFPASEQTLYQFNKTHSQTPVRGTLPLGGTYAMDYPWAPSSTLTTNARTIADAVQAELSSPTTVKALRAAGFRTGDLSTGPSLDGVAASRYRTFTPLKPAIRTATLGQWDAVRKDMRMLAVLDVSGSMKQPAGKGTRAQVAAESAVAALKLLPAGSQIGGWVFSTDKGGPGKDYKELVPVRQLDAPVGSVTQRDVLVAAVKKMPSLLGGDTALYDTTLAAWRQMNKTYDPNYVNSVVVLTDGKNDDPKGGATLQQVLAAIKKEGDPERPVKVVTIGIGANTDPASAEAIGKATTGSSFVAKNPADISKVFVEALLLRSSSQG